MCVNFVNTKQHKELKKNEKKKNKIYNIYYVT